jgi:hypothetical protein
MPNDNVVILLFFCFAFFSVLFLVASGIFWLSGETPFDSTKVDSEIVNGILTASSIIFGFQFAFFRVPRNKKARIAWAGIFLGEALNIGFVGYNYLQTTMSYGYLSTYTLVLAFLSLAVNLLLTVVLAFLDWIISSE